MLGPLSTILFVPYLCFYFLNLGWINGANSKHCCESFYFDTAYTALFGIPRMWNFFHPYEYGAAFLQPSSVALTLKSHSYYFTITGLFLLVYLKSFNVQNIVGMFNIQCENEK